MKMNQWGKKSKFNQSTKTSKADIWLECLNVHLQSSKGFPHLLYVPPLQHSWIIPSCHKIWQRTDSNIQEWSWTSDEFCCHQCRACIGFAAGRWDHLGAALVWRSEVGSYYFPRKTWSVDWFFRKYRCRGLGAKLLMRIVCEVSSHLKEWAYSLVCLKNC